ncbi:ABC-2 transporter family protein [Clostridium sporogenes]|uniref:ABC-2 transporter family protein n=1 Tax=Clostridium sporogenes TaxID=1509 RepID=A0A1L3NJY2_CLOSG|nr:ABC transporter permease subunit [Clostridium sporogenes]APH16404.1 ABC-2 transporter family protein [Clostridium sporogenes]
MFSLIKFEFKKLAKKKSNIITILVSIILTIILFSMSITRFEYFNLKGHYTGLKAIELKKQDAKKLPIEVKEDQVEKDIKNYQSLFLNPANTIKTETGQLSLKNHVFLKYVQPKYDYLSMIAVNYCKPGGESEVYDLSNLLRLKFQNGAKFYETRNNKISTFLNMDHKGGNYSDKEKKFWINKISKVKTPYTYGYYVGWESLLRIFGTLVFTLLAIIITVAPMFAGEYQCGADSIILSSKYGKTKIIKAKIIAAFAFATIIFVLNLIFALAIPLLSFGTDGWNLPIQIQDTMPPYKVTFLGATVMCIGIAYVVILGSVSFTLLLSAKLKTPFTVLIVQIIILFASLFMKEGADNSFYNHILYLLPSKAIDYEFSKYLSYSFGGVIVSLLLMRVIVYGAMGVISLPLVSNAFRKHQVQ